MDGGEDDIRLVAGDGCVEWASEAGEAKKTSEKKTRVDKPRQASTDEQPRELQAGERCKPKYTEHCNPNRSSSIDTDISVYRF